MTPIALSESAKQFTDQQLADEQLVALFCQATDGHRQHLFNQLAQRHRVPLQRYCRRMMRRDADADDVVQETLLRAYRFLAGFQGQSSFRTWLYRIADNQCYSWLQKEARYCSEPTPEPILDAQEAEAIDPHLCAQVQSTLMALPDPARDVLQLRFLSELSLQDISQVLDISLSASKMRLYRAQQQFAELYQAA